MIGIALVLSAIELVSEFVRPLFVFHWHDGSAAEKGSWRLVYLAVALPQVLALLLLIYLSVRLG